MSLFTLLLIFSTLPHLLHSLSPSSHMSRSSFPISASKPGFLRTLGAGVSVQIGTSATLSYSLTLQNAILASDLVTAGLDSRFVSKLSKPGFQTYRQLRSAYSAGLSVPFLRYLGADLSVAVTQQNMQSVASKLPQYASLSFEARAILDGVKRRTINIKGTKTVTGHSFIPKVYYAYVKVAKVELVGGGTLYVVSGLKEDVGVADYAGHLEKEDGGREQEDDEFEVEEETEDGGKGKWLGAFSKI